MRFIGNKENLLDKIYQEMNLRNIKGKSFFDFFAGTSSVGRFFKKLNYQIYSSDILYFSFVLQQAYIVNNDNLAFKKLLKNLNFTSQALLVQPLETVVEYLNQIKPIKGFIYTNYTPEGSADLEIPRMFFSNENGQIIDAIRQQIEIWKTSELISNSEYYVLIACLIETVPFYANISGVYAAFHKKWDPRAIKKMVLRPIEIVKNDKDNYSYNANSVSLISKIKTDILYLDPPYNQRQYAPNYHLLETIALYDSPPIKGVAGLRAYQDQKSNFCNANTALIELKEIAGKADYKTLILSYNSEGIMEKDSIIATLKNFGNVELVEFQYSRYKSNNNGESKTKKFIIEQLYILQKDEK